MRRVTTSDSKHFALPGQQCEHKRNLFSLFPKSVFFLLYFLVVGLVAFAQTTTTFPSASSCTSKDLELVGATLTGGNTCNSCTPGTILTRTLTLAINNKTGSSRTAFAFWGTLVITHADNSVETSPIKGCSGPIPPTGPLPSSYSKDFNTITYTCGDALKIKDLFLAWTDASPKSTCATINSATINPKCGTLPEIQINAGVNGSAVAGNLTCFGASNGTINLTPFGGTAPYTFSWSASNGGSIPSGQSTSEDLTGLTKGTYTCVISDSKSCTFSKVVTLTGPSAALSLGASSKTDVTCFGGTNGTVTAGTVSNAVGTVHYSWKNASNVEVATTANKSGLPAGAYTLTVT
ncbi:SprB repeat-containing protein, partial [Flavisolibacter ginsengisoli]